MAAARQQAGWADQRAPVRELIEEDNADLMASLDGASWSAYSEAMSEADFFDLGTDDDPMQVVKDHLLAALRRTGSLGSDHRKDYVEASRAAAKPTMALGMPIMQPEATKPPKGGM
jgi:hypothetical protein